MGAAELRNYEREVHQFQLRIGVAGIAVVIGFLLLAARFVYLQVVQHDIYRAKAEDNRISIVPVPPNRGLIVDRNGLVLARNYSGYTLEIFPRRTGSVEGTIDELSELIEITPRDRRLFKKLVAETRNAESLPIRTRLSDEEVAKFAANRYRFEGVEIKGRLFRQYPYGDVASHVLGYMGRIDQADQARLEEDGVDANYRGTDYIGKAGVEASYQHELHGTTGFEHVEIDAAGRGIRALSRTASQPGNSIALTLDMTLQQVARQAPEQPRHCRHVPARLDLQAIHGASRARARQAHAAQHDPRPGLLRVRRPALPRLQARRPRRGRPLQIDRRLLGHLLLPGSERPRDRRHRRLHEAFRLRRAHRHRPAGRGRRRAAVAGMEDEALQAARAAEVVRRRDHLDRHRPGLQRVHPGPASAGDGHPRQRRLDVPPASHRLRR